jgi:hypothetical protein
MASGRLAEAPESISRSVVGTPSKLRQGAVPVFIKKRPITGLREQEFPAHLAKSKGPAETITSNCHVQTAFPPHRLEIAKHLSKMSGQTTIIKEQVT